MRPDLLKRLQHAYEQAFARLQENERRMADNVGPAKVGDLFLIPNYLGLFFAIVNVHPDDSNLMLVVPVADIPFHGVTDVVEDNSYYGRLVAHCGLSFWFEKRFIPVRPRATWESVKECRTILHKLATGKALVITEEQECTDADPEYNEHCQQVERLTQYLTSPKYKFYFIDGNYPEVLYYGTVRDMDYIAEGGGCPNVYWPDANQSRHHGVTEQWPIRHFGA